MFLLRTRFHPFGILVFKQSRRSRKLCKSAPTASREEEYQGIFAEDKVRSDPCTARNEVSVLLCVTSRAIGHSLSRKKGPFEGGRMRIVYNSHQD